MDKSGGLGKSNEGNKSDKNSQSGERNVQKSKRDLQKSNNSNAMKNRYSGVIRKRNRKDLTNSDEDISDIPDIKVFDDVELCIDEDEIKVEKLKRLPKDHQKNLKSLRNIRSTQLSGRGDKETMKVSWKMDDLFLGFMNDDG